jgi:hypothetical protein
MTTAPGGEPHLQPSGPRPPPLGHGVVQHEAHVGLVDAHAKLQAQGGALRQCLVSAIEKGSPMDAGAGWLARWLRGAAPAAAAQRQGAQPGARTAMVATTTCMAPLLYATCAASLAAGSMSAW